MDTFYRDISAQTDRLLELFMAVFQSYEATKPNTDLDARARIQTREFIAGTKYVLDQITLRKWSDMVRPVIEDEEKAAAISKLVYYPYDVDGQRLSSLLGKIIPKDRTGDASVAEFIGWITSCQPSADARFKDLGVVCELSRLAHRHLILQSKQETDYVLEAYAAMGGGHTITSKEPPGPFAIVTSRDETTASVSIVFGENVTMPDNLPENAIMEILQYDPATMSFTDMPGAHTSVTRKLECRIDDFEFDALEVFPSAIDGMLEVCGLHILHDV